MNGASPAPTVRRTDPQRVRVLVVDDNAGFRESLLTLLDTDELVVVGEACNGPEALRLVGEVGPDVVLMDVRMPAMDGVETTRRLKELHPSIEVVALSGSEDQNAVREMLVAGASGYVLKDSDGDDILDAVRRAATGGGVISPEVTPAVIEELTDALERERGRARELEEAHAELVRRAERRQELVARLGHELRTPVAVILGMAQTLAEGNVTPEQQEELLGRLVVRANGLARLAERFELTVDAALTESVSVHDIADLLAAGDPRVTVRSTGALPVASLNPPVARRILDELVDNALRFSPPGSPVEIRIKRGPTRIELRVADQGSGIDDVDRDRIFEPLEQAEALNARTHQGAGLGLSVARTAARAMEGDVVLESSGPQGSVFLWTVAFAH